MSNTNTMTKAHVQIGDKTVVRYNIITTPFWIYTVYEPTRINTPAHSTICSGAEYGVEGFLGRMFTRALPEEINALPVGGTRWQQIDLWKAKLNAEIENLIHKAFPETAGREASNGEIEINTNR